MSTAKKKPTKSARKRNEIADASVDDEEKNNAPKASASNFSVASSGSKVGKQSKMGNNKLSPATLTATQNFFNFVKEKGIGGFVKMFKEDISIYIPPADLYKFPTWGSNKERNRFEDVVCLEHSRVTLRAEEPVTPKTDYIHANYVKFPEHDRVYISTQCPLTNTLEEFWIMVFQEKSPVIVCIGKDGEYANFVQYWPLGEGTHEKFGTMWIHTRKKDTDKDSFTVFTVEVLPEGCSNSHFTKVIWVDNWGNRSKYANGLSICRLIRQMNSVDAMAVNDGPMIIHCSTGIGRTATLIIVDVILQRLFAHGKSVDLLSLCRSLREQRMSSIQHLPQFLNIICAVLGYCSKRRLPGFKELHTSFVEETKKV